MTESLVIDDVKCSLELVRKGARLLKDDLLSFLLDMTILHLSRKLTAVNNRPATLPKSHNLNIIILERNNPQLRLLTRQLSD
jgi:hypothetical protein